MITDRYYFMKLIFLAGTLILTLSAFPQDKSNGCQCKFQSINNIGIVEGSQGSAFHLQTVNGIAMRKWFVGLGAGIDYYRFRSVPLSIETRKEFSNKNINPFVYGAAGIHLPWKRDNEMYYSNADLSGGLYYDLGLGLQFATSKTNGFTISAGYSFKRVTETIHSVPYCLVGPCPEYEQKREYGLKRVSMKVGWRFRSI